MAAPKASWQGSQIILEVQVKKGLSWKPISAFVDSEAEVNCINALWAKFNKWESKESELPVIHNSAEQLLHSQRLCSDKVQVVDSTDTKRVFQEQFYIVPDLEFNVYLEYLWLQEQNPQFNWVTQMWHHHIHNDFLIQELMLKDFKDIDENKPVFIAACVQVIDNILTEKTQVLSKELSDFSILFSSNQEDFLPQHNLYDHSIVLEESKEPSFEPLYNLSEKELKVLRGYIEQTLNKGWIHHSISLIEVPILFVLKQNESLWLCVNYWALNNITIKNRHLLPLINKTLAQFTGARYFTKLDLQDVYHQLRIKKGDEWKTVFCMQYSHFEYIIMPFGLTNAFIFFQIYINKLMTELLNIICVVYLNDILIYISNENSEMHWKAVRKVLEHLKEFQLFFKFKKCKFMTTEVEFLRFIMSSEGVSMEICRVKTVTEWSEFTSIKKI